jgi:hypothetical protein
MVKLPDDVKKLIQEYRKKFPGKPIGFNNDEWDSIEQFRNYLKRMLRDSK